MDDDPTIEIKSNILTEWSLFWDSLRKERPEIEEDFDTNLLETLNLSQIKDMTRSLSQGRKQLNQKIESLNKEIELNSAKLESLRLVGASDEETLLRINELTDHGQKLSLELMRLDQKLKLAREFELEMNEQSPY